MTGHNCFIYRDHEKLSNKVEAAKKQNEARFTENEEKQKQCNDTIAKVLENQEELKSFFRTSQSNVEKLSSTIIAQNNSSKKIINNIR